ncbi:hypothetical protein Tcan_02252 [Toxocara canis]|uniref:Uncharacterized protein n=1 Tax=Toxocara canis TaxID=6265 RepID=A0A0B2UK61_TOXCA|nr:hypothetical protein Tcan_02252 [Toxocara canis]
MCELQVIHKGLSARNCLLGEHDTAKGKHPYNEIKNNTLLRQKILMEGLRLTPPEGLILHHF